VGDRQQMPPAPTVAAIRATKLLVLLVPERGEAIASLASCNIDSGFIHEFHVMFSRKYQHKKARQRRPSILSDHGETVRSLRYTDRTTTDPIPSPSNGDDVHHLSVQGAFDCERHATCRRCKQGVSLAHANVISGMQPRAALTNNDRAGADQLTAE